MGIVGIMAAEQVLLAASSLIQGVVGVGTGAFVLLVSGGALLGVRTAWLAVPVSGIIAILLAPTNIRSVPRLRTASNGTFTA